MTASHPQPPARRRAFARRSTGGRAFLGAALVLGLAAAAAARADWPSWRGPEHDGTSPETGLVETWSRQGENLLWRADFSGRSTPVVFDDRACANGRVGEGDTRQEMVACFDAATGRKLWELRFPVYHTTVPWNRVGWANVLGDPETGYLYVQGVGGLFYCLDRAGKVVWWRSFEEELGFISGYGGRTQTPALDEDRVIVTFVGSAWGETGAPRHRVYAFDKKDGRLLWVSTPGEFPADFNSQSTPMTMEAGGRRLLLHGNGDGNVYALEARTGRKVFAYPLSKMAINTTVLIDGTTVYAAQSEENPGGGTMGAVAAFAAPADPAPGAAPRELWRTTIEVGYASPTLHDGVLYVVDNSANLLALDAASGRHLWTHDLGTVGKGSPVWADGKVYATEVNGRFHILRPTAEGATALDDEMITMPEGRHAEIYGSAAVADGRVYFTTEEGFYCLGTKGAGRASAAAPPSGPGSGRAEVTLTREPPPAGAPTTLLVVPAEATIATGDSLALELRAFDDLGRPVAPPPGAAWTLQGLAGTLDGGRFTPDPARGVQVGKVAVQDGGLKAEARVRVFPPPPLAEDFESYAAGGRPPYLLRATSHFTVEEKDGRKVLAKNPPPRDLARHTTYLGPHLWRDYTVQADLMGTKTGRKVPDLGIINSGYTLDVMGGHQQIQVRSWAAELRMARQVPFAWQPGVWYTAKLRVEERGGHSLVQGKVWPAAEPEPEAWTITVDDPIAIRQGSPGLYGYSPTAIYFDNVKVTKNR